MFIVDAHLDLSMNAMEWNRDLRSPIADIRAREKGMTDKPDRGNGTVCFPELRKGNIGLVVATQIARFVSPDNPLPGWHSPEQAWAQTQGQLAWYRAMEEAGELDNTLIVISGDHGPPGFPHGKCNLYDFGSSVSLAIRGFATGELTGFNLDSAMAVLSYFMITVVVIVVAVGLRYWGSVNYMETPPRPYTQKPDLKVLELFICTAPPATKPFW